MLTFLKRLWARLFQRSSLSPADRRARANEATYRKWLADTQFKVLTKRPDLIRVYTDRAGNNFYIFKDPLQMTAERVTATELAVAATEYNLTKADLLERLKRMQAAAADVRASYDMGRLDEIQTELSEIIYRADRLGTEETMLELACLFFLIDGENPETLNQITTDRKKELALADDDLRAFFLRTSWDLFKTSTGLGAQAFLTYLGQQKKRERKQRTRPTRATGNGGQ